MKVRILEKSEEGKWDEFVQQHELGTIHQLSKWGHFQARVPARGKYWILVVESSDKIVGGTVLIRHSLPKGLCWLYAARGPVVEYLDGSKLALLVDEVKKIAVKERAVFMRIDPPLLRGGVKVKGFRQIEEGFQPQHTLIVDLQASEEEILAQMKQKGRYNIKVAEKKGVHIRAGKGKKDIGEFYRLLQETTDRDGFRGHGEDYYQAMLEELGDSYAKLWLAEYEGEVIAGAIVTYFGKVATYYYGVSSNKYRNVMAPYLLHWEVMKEAKERGFEQYDLFGIAPEGREKGHAWEGVTSFKRKFGGSYVKYLRPQEYSFQAWLYWAYRLYKWWKK